MAVVAEAVAGVSRSPTTRTTRRRIQPDPSFGGPCTGGQTERLADEDHAGDLGAVHLQQRRDLDAELVGDAVPAVAGAHVVRAVAVGGGVGPVRQAQAVAGEQDVVEVGGVGVEQ